MSEENNEILAEIINIYDCKNCKKIYKNSAGLLKHSIKCIQNENNLSNKELIMVLVKENFKLKNMISKLTDNSLDVT